MKPPRPEPYFATNIASGNGYSVKKILRTALEVGGYDDADVRFYPSKPLTISVRLFDTRKARNVLGFEAETSLAAGFQQTI